MKPSERWYSKQLRPLTLDAALAVHDEMQTRIEQADRLRRQHVERRRYEAELARSRFLQVDPANRLVAASLEADWNERLRDLRDAEDEYERHQRLDRAVVSDEQREKILRLASDFPRVWRDPKTPMRERKRLVRLVIEDVTLLKREEIAVHVRFKGGTTKSIVLPKPLAAYEIRKTRPKVIAEIDRLLDSHTEGEIAAMLNEQGLCSGERKAFHRLMVQRLREEYALESRYTRLRHRGLLTLAQIARKLRVRTCTIKLWRRAGLLRAHAYNDKNQYLYEEPGADAPKKYKWKMPRRKRPGRRSAPERDA
jgi:hypothetical protein